MKTLNKGMIHTPGWTEWNGKGFHEDGMQFRTCQLLISGIFHLTSLDCSSPQVAKTEKSKPADKKGLQYS